VPFKTKKPNAVLLVSNLLHNGRTVSNCH